MPALFSDPGAANDELYDWVWSGFDSADQVGTSTYAARLTALNVTSAGQFEGPDNGVTATKTLTLTVTDADGGSALANATAQVLDNTPVIVDVSQDFVPSAQSDEPAIATLDIEVEAETDSDLLTQVRVNWGDPNIADSIVTTVNGTGTAGTTISVTAPSAYIESGTYTATVTVSDEDSSASSTINITVDNVAPTISLVETTPPQPVIVTEGQSLSVRATATDPSTVDAVALNFQVNWDDGATDFAVGSSTGTSGEARSQFSHVYTNPGTYTVNITVTDPDGGVDSSTLTVEVLNRAPSITDVFNTGPVDENTSVSAVLLVSNPGADVLRYSYNFNCTTTTEASVSDADFSEPKPGTGTSAVRANTFGDDGSYPVCVRVCDDDGPNFGCDYGLTTVQVDNVAPVITSFPAPAAVQENSTGAVVALTVTASDVGPSDTLSYAFDCDSNGSIDATSTNGTANCTYTTSGTFTASVRVTDGDGGIATGTTVVRITNAAPTIASATGLNVDEGNATTVTVTASDVGGDALTYRFDFNNDGQFDVQKSTNSATWTYTTDGAKTVGVEVCDSEGACATSTASLTIANVAPEILSVSAPSSVSRGTSVTVIADAIDAGNDALKYQFTIKDSSGATVYSSPVQASNVATATITDSGSYTVDVVVSDAASAPNTVLTDTGSAAFTVTDISVAVNVVANPSTITEGGSTTITVSPSGTGPYLVRYDINGDGDFNDAEDIATGTPCTTCSATGIVYADNRAGNLPYRVLVEVTDTGEGNAVATALVSVTVNNAPPTIANINDIAAAPEQTALSLTINGSDVGANDTITYSLVSGPAGITVNPTSGALTWTPNWTDEGANSITVRATDKDGGIAEETFTVTVTIIDTNGNNISDTRERELNNGNLLPAGADQLDTDNDGVSDLQEVLDGTDPTVSDAPSAPIVLTPNRESVDTLRPTLTVVNAVSPRRLALTYTFVVLDDTGAEVTRISGVAGGNNITSTDVDVDLDEDAVYTWYAFADDGLVSGDDSQIGEFRVNTSNSAPPIPENLTPVDATTLPTGALVALELRAVVDPDGDEVSYEFEVATDAAFTDVVAQSALRSVPFYSIPEALPAGTYFWRGQATDGIDDSGFGASTTFTIEESTFNTAPPAPGIVAPNDVVLSATSATLEISGVTDPDGDDVQYVFEIADNAAFANAQTSGLQDALTFDVTGLAEDTLYFWRARAFDGQAASDWALASFGVNAQNSAPTGLQLLSPAPGALLERAPSGLVWSQATDADGDSLTYTVELATTEDFAEVLYTEEFTSGDSVFEAAPTGVTFDPTLTYFWRVTVTDGTDSDVQTGSFDIYAAPFVDSTTEDTGCGCASVEKPASQQPVALIFGLMMAGLLVIRRRRRD
ncbi:MAG: PKD domain-containing protein [bacterium]